MAVINFEVNKKWRLFSTIGYIFSQFSKLDNQWINDNSRIHYISEDSTYFNILKKETLEIIDSVIDENSLTTK
jgi:hypothetical protein